MKAFDRHGKAPRAGEISHEGGFPVRLGSKAVMHVKHMKRERRLGRETLEHVKEGDRVGAARDAD